MGSDIPPDRLPLRLRGQHFPVKIRHMGFLDEHGGVLY
jgi:hypothetical protein